MATSKASPSEVGKQARSLILRLLKRRFGELPDELQTQIQALSLEKLEALTDALLDFSTLADLEGWLQD
ncbi:hypothetical protein BV375_19655 [Nostoc sp. 106C]|nr:hypothetical protein BV375_19655 [Nostoc sp. 106C]